MRPTRNASQILVATPPNDPNQLGLAILELLLFTEGINCLTLGSGVPAQEAPARRTPTRCASRFCSSTGAFPERSPDRKYARLQDRLA